VLRKRLRTIRMAAIAATCLGVLAWAVTESLATGPVTVASDSFNRTVSGGWGTAEVGGSWTLLDTPADWSVAPGIGSISVPAGAQQRAVLGSVSTQNVNLLAKIVLPRCTGSGANCDAFLLGRVSGGSSPTYYRVGVVQGQGSTILLRAQRSEGSFLSGDLNTGIPAANGAVVWLRVEFQGSSPTTIRARAWLDGTTEPTSWLLSTTDTTAAEQVAGAVGVRARNEDTAASHTFEYESFLATETVSSPVKPTVKTESASSVSANGATLHGLVNPNGFEVTECKLEYGTTNTYGSSVPCTPAPGAGTSSVAVAGAISGLKETTTYHFRVVAKNAGGTSEGADAEFTTTSSTPVKPTVKTEPASSVAANTATLNGLVNPNGFEVSECKLEYGTSTTYTNSATCTPPPGSGSANVAVSAAISGLAENTTYHFRVLAKNAGGTSEGADESFKTTSTPVKGDWPKYLHDLGSSGFTTENLITRANASALRSATGWPVQGSGRIVTQPVVANNLVYWGTWDGYEHATALPGSLASGWATDLGAATSSGCGSTNGVASTGAVASVTLAGQTSPRSVLFVGGGGTDAAGGGSAQLYALDALTGSVLWRTPLGPSPNNFMWSSPAVYTYTNSSGATVTSVYVGVASFGDCPLVQGRVVQVDATSGQVQHTFAVVPSGCTGGGVWGSPTIDQSDGSLYVATGNPGSCSSAQPYAEALVKLRASDLSVLGSWQIPGTEKTADGDFGAAPTLFSGTVSSGGALRSLVGVPNKNGVYYVFDRSQVSAGPVAKPHVAVAGDCPQCGKGSISPSAWDGTTLYVAGGNTTIKGTSYAGSLRAFDPNNLSTPLWEDGLDGPVLGAVTAAPGLAVVGEGHYTVVVDASNGNVLLRAPVNSISSSSPANFWGAPSIADGTLFEGDTHGYLYAYTGG
jgi:PQQ enzyme repeat